MLPCQIIFLSVIPLASFSNQAYCLWACNSKATAHFHVQTLHKVGLHNILVLHKDHLDPDPESIILVLNAAIQILDK